MKKVISALLVITLLWLSPADELMVGAKEEPKELHARSAVLMDAGSGRILFTKNGDEKLAMASTTKIMTCILALEYGRDELVTVSANAAKQPRVHLGMREGERYRLTDLLYSLMLESHNDTAVAIAEHIAGSVPAFATLMNQKVKELGFTDTYFITPNGLDATDERGTHATTARDLAGIMRYCVMQSPKKELFREITKKESHTFGTVDGKRQFTCVNHNAFLTMMEGAFSGKTGFTGDAGYCYVGALERDERTYIVALLGCGWPNNRNYKWQDTKILMRYGIENFAYRREIPVPKEVRIPVRNGIESDFVTVGISDGEEELKKSLHILMCQEDILSCEMKVEEILEAPLVKGERVGVAQYRLNGELVAEAEILLKNTISRKNYGWFLLQIIETFFVQKGFDFSL